MADLVKKLQKLGWSAEPVDICWMACDRAGHHNAIITGDGGEGYEIILCRPHIEEMESTSKGGYSQAAFPAASNHEDIEHDWWPWRDITTGEVVDFL